MQSVVLRVTFVRRLNKPFTIPLILMKKVTNKRKQHWSKFLRKRLHVKLRLHNLSDLGILLTVQL